MAEVTEYKCGQQCAACGRQREGGAVKSLGRQRNLDRADEQTNDSGQSKRHQTKAVHIDQLALIFLLVAGFCNHELLAFFFHICLGELRNQLNEEDNADNAEQICNAVTNGDSILILRCYGCLCCRERRCTGQSARKNADEHCNKFLRIRLCALADKITADTGQTAGDDDDQSEQDVGFVVFLEILEEVRTCNKTNCGYEEDQSDILNDLERIGADISRCTVCEFLCHSLADRIGEQCAVQQCNDEYARCAE